MDGIVGDTRIGIGCLCFTLHVSSAGGVGVESEDNIKEVKAKTFSFSVTNI